MIIQKGLFTRKQIARVAKLFGQSKGGGEVDPVTIFLSFSLIVFDHRAKIGSNTLCAHIVSYHIVRKHFWNAVDRPVRIGSWLTR